MSTRSNIMLQDVVASPFLEMVSGEGKGITFPLSGTRISIGRSDDNDVIIQSDAVSRHHAFLEMSSEGIWGIRDNQSKNGISVNGEKVEACDLQSGDLIQVGNFAFRFDDGALVASSEDVLSLDETPLEGGLEVPAYEEPVAAPKSNKRVAIYGFVAILFGLLYFMNSGEEKKPAATTEDGKPVAAAETTPKGDLKITGEPPFTNPPEGSKIPGIEDPVDKVEKEVGDLPWSNPGIRESEQFFKKGQRELQNHNYARAIEAFNTAMTLNRNHEMARRYHTLALFEAETDAKKNMEMARRYFESLQYSRAIYHFNEVISLLAHRPNEGMVKEAERYISLARRKLQAAELFP